MRLMSYKTAIVVLSDSRSSGEREDLVIPTCRKLLADTQFIIGDTRIIPDDTEAIIEALESLVSNPDISLVITSGGTGLAPRDNAPEATRAVIDREAPGLAELVRLKGLDHTPKAMLTRGVAGAKGKTLIINLPGSPKAVREGFEALMPVLPHALETLLGQASECGGSH
jgi:molybdopterin adenylyltransferase